MALRKLTAGMLGKLRQAPVINALLIFACLAVLLSGVFVRIKVFRDSRSLSFDEACLTMNILQRSYSGLLQPLDEDQGAPLGFLFLLKLTSQVLGESEEALRALALIAGLASIFIFALLAYQLFSRAGPPLRHPAFWIAILLFALHPALVRYAVEVKQYSTDVLSGLLLLVCGLKFLEGPRAWRTTLGMALAGLLAILVSHPAVFTLGGIGLCWGWAEFRKIRAQSSQAKFPWQVLAKMGLVGMAWIGCFAGIYLLSLAGLSQNSFLQAFWKAGFAPWPLQHPQDFLWYLERPRTMYESLSSNPFASIAAFFSVIGAFFWLRKSGPRAALFLIPVGLNAFTAFLNIYPFSSRLILYLVPTSILLTAIGIDAVAAALQPKQGLLLSGLAVVMLCAYPAAMVFDPAMRGLTDQNLSGVVTYMLKNWQNGDKIYVYSGARCQFRYYAHRFGISQKTFTIGSPQVEKTAALQDWKSGLRGDVQPALGQPRTWFIFSNYSYLDLPGALEILDQYGQQVQSVVKTGASGYLYDLAP